MWNYLIISQTFIYIQEKKTASSSINASVHHSFNPLIFWQNFFRTVTHLFKSLENILVQMGNKPAVP